MTPSARGAVLPLACALALLGAGLWRAWLCDDAFISLVAVNNLLAGFGPVFNIGERVEVFSHPLWLGLLALGSLLTGAPELCAVGLGLLLSAGALLLSWPGPWRRAGPAQGGRPLLPFGVLLVLALPPFWDFATSGLETGLSLCWLALCQRVLRGEPEAARPRPLLLGAGVLGLGPLIRPDLALCSAGFLLILGVRARPLLPRARWLKILLGGVALPGLYQVFRMGYFASPLPNPALAKSWSSPYWSQGFHYLVDFLSPYGLVLPLALILLAVLLRARGGAGGDRVGLATAGLGLLHGALVVRGGGDFMHGRYLLPALFLVLLPVAYLPLPAAGWARRLAPLAAAAVALWALWCAAWGRVPYGKDGPHLITDERAYYVAETGSPHPVRLRGAFPDAPHRDLRAWRARGLQLARQPLARRRAEHLWGGMPAFAYGPAAYAWAGGGLSDPVGARFELQARGRVGHEKEVPDAWKVARFPGFVQAAPDPVAFAAWAERERAPIAAARRALSCPPLRELLAAVQQPLDLARFLANVRYAWRGAGPWIPRDPQQAASRLCGAQRSAR